MNITQCSQSKTAVQTVTSEGARYHNLWFCDWYIHIYIWVLASTLDPSVSKINEALSVTYKLLFILSKNIVPSRSYRYIRDRAFPVTRLPPPIYTKFDVKQRYIYTYIYRYIDTYRGYRNDLFCKRVNF